MTGKDVRKLEELEGLRKDCGEALKILGELKDEYGGLAVREFDLLSPIVYNGIFGELRAIRARAEAPKSISIDIREAMQGVMDEIRRIEETSKKAGSDGAA